MTITNEDNMDLMARYEDNYFDLAIVDPPYGIGRFGNRVEVSNRICSSAKINKWDKKPNKEFFNQLFRVSKNQIIWGANNFTLPETEYFCVWDKKQTVDNFASAEYAWVSMGLKKPAKVFRYSIHQAIQERKKQGGKFHPTQKPVKLYEWLLMNYATCKTCKNEGGYYEDVAGDGGSQMWQVCDDCNTHERPVRILDTHLGSGSIAIACHNLGFDLTACELDKDYYEAAMKRINEHKNQLRMF